METSKWVVVVASIVCAWYYIQVRKDERPAVVKTLNASYDYIIVGAGSAGSALAAQLSEDPNSTVLVLEAGKEDVENPLYDMPRNFWFTLDTDGDWQYRTVPQKYAGQSIVNKQIKWPRGRMLGGTSQLNAMFFVRGSKYDFDAWAGNGCDGWSYKDVLPYFKKFENIDDDSYAATGYRGRDGPMKIQSGPHSSTSDMFVQAGRDKGCEVGDYNGENQEVFGKGQINVIDGQRGSSSRVFLRPAMVRSNLHVAVKAHVTRILFQGKKAVAVEVIHDGVKKIVRTRKEIILSAGSVGSPQILMLSGIGPQKHLQEMKIPVIQNLPVGENLDDHAQVAIKFFITNPQTPLNVAVDTFWERIKYQLTGKSVALGKPQLGGDAATFLRVGSHWTKKMPNIEIIFNPPFDTDGLHMLRILGYNDEAYAHLSQLPDNLPHGSAPLSMLVTLLNAKSKGTIKLKSRDPFDHPEIDPNYFKEIEDIKSMIAGIRYAQSLTSTETFKKNGIILGELPYPKCTKEAEFDSDEYWECFIRNFAVTIFHPTSTCRMAALNDENSVVDPLLRVKGIQGLRVVDASIMPIGTSGNTNAPVMMIAHKAADIIRGRH